MKKFNIGDVVVIKNTGKVYSTYQDWADLHNLNNYAKTKNPNSDTVVTVKCVGYHGGGDALILYGVTDGKNDYIIGEDGLEKHVEYKWQWLVKKMSYRTHYYDTTSFFKTEEQLKSALPHVQIVYRIEESKRVAS